MYCLPAMCMGAEVNQTIGELDREGEKHWVKEQ